jgi:hypothetical protein
MDDVELAQNRISISKKNFSPPAASKKSASEQKARTTAMEINFLEAAIFGCGLVIGVEKRRIEIRQFFCCYSMIKNALD